MASSLIFSFRSGLQEFTEQLQHLQRDAVSPKTNDGTVDYSTLIKLIESDDMINAFEIVGFGGRGLA